MSIAERTGRPTTVRCARARGAVARRSSIVLGAVALVVGSAQVDATSAHAATPHLHAFESCGGLVAYARRHALRTGGEVGVPVRAGTAPLPEVAPPPRGGSREEALAGEPAVGGGSFSTTNVQEVGVDEPDVVKSDGARVLAIVNGALHAADVSGGVPRRLGSLPLAEGANQQLVVRGDTALVIAEADGATVLTEVAVGDPAAMRVLRTLTLDGSFIGARLSGGTARVVVSSAPRAFSRARAIRRAGLRTWVPRFVLRSRLSRRTARRTAVGCDDVRRPARFSGLDLLTVLTVDLDQGLYALDRDALMAGAQTVYASPGGLYVASQRYDAGDPGRVGLRTAIHRFDTSQAGATTYRSSGEVTGSVLNQFALSEHAGALRVASTTEPPWDPDGAEESETFVTVLTERDGALTAVGRVGGLGRGERVQSVRFLAEQGYVVTFREVDPLYTLDLSAPTAPRVAGELKLLGYSAYLHPLGDGLLLGVGQDATREGRRRGAQLSLFDVSDPGRPVRLHQRELGALTSSEVEIDHRAFLWWAPARLAVLPVERTEPTPLAAAAGLRVGRMEGIAEVGRVVHEDGEAQAPIARSLVAGDRLYTLSYKGLVASRLDTLAPVASVPLGTPRRVMVPGRQPIDPQRGSE